MSKGWQSELVDALTFVALIALIILLWHWQQQDEKVEKPQMGMSASCIVTQTKGRIITNCPGKP